MATVIAIYLIGIIPMLCLFRTIGIMLDLIDHDYFRHDWPRWWAMAIGWPVMFAILLVATMWGTYEDVIRLTD